MTRKSASEAIDWMKRQIDHPSQNWDHMCMSSARQAWGQAPWAASARLAWARVPERHRHYTTQAHVPVGAVCFGLLNTNYGHAWIAGRGPADARVGFSVDYKRKGRIDRVPLLLPAWTHDTKVHWTDWSPFGMLPVDPPPKHH